LTLRLDADITKDFHLAGKAYVRILLKITAQPEFFHKGERVGVNRGRNGDAISATQAIPMTVGKFPQATVNGHIIL